MEITSGILTQEQVEKELAEVSEFLKRFDIKEIEVFFGIGCHEDLKDLWKNKRINTEDLDKYINGYIKSGLFTPSKGDFCIINADIDLRIHFCHDSDIHFKCSNSLMVKAKEEIWKRKNFPGYTKKGEEWKPFNYQV